MAETSFALRTVLHQTSLALYDDTLPQMREIIDREVVELRYKSFR